MVDSLTPPRLGVLSGRYAVRRRAAGATTVEVWYHPTHTENVDRVLHAAVVALGELERRFGPYTLPTLRIVEVPAGWGFGAFALPGTILLTETRGMRLDPRREQVDLLLRRIGHEVAHQWWGGVVSPADVDGAGTIVEALAKYAEQRVVASVHGDSALAPMLAFDHDRYLVGRAQESAAERTLADAGFVDDYLFYGKAAIGFRALHDALGDSAMTAALRAFIAAERGPRGAATTDALRAAIDAHAATPATRALIAEWFDARVIHELVVDTATVQPRGARFHVVVRGHVDRVTRVGRGEEAHPASGAEVEVWLGSEYATAQGSWSGRVACDSAGRFTVAVTLDAPPTIVELDPRYLRVDPNRSNNRRAVVPLASGSDARAAVAARVQRW
jgi:aminopeptidase N